MFICLFGWLVVLVVLVGWLVGFGCLFVLFVCLFVLLYFVLLCLLCLLPGSCVDLPVFLPRSPFLEFVQSLEEVFAYGPELQYLFLAGPERNINVNNKLLVILRKFLETGNKLLHLSWKTLPSKCDCYLFCDSREKSQVVVSIFLEVGNIELRTKKQMLRNIQTQTGISADVDHECLTLMSPSNHSLIGILMFASDTSVVKAVFGRPSLSFKHKRKKLLHMFKKMLRNITI